MNYYETLYVVHPALESGRLKDIIISVQEMCTNLNSKIISIDVWGKKKLAYLIDKQKYGTYVLVQFQSTGENINEIATEISSEVVRKMMNTEVNTSNISAIVNEISKKQITKYL